MRKSELRKQLKEQFKQVVAKDANLTTLAGVFDAMTTQDFPSSVPEAHYQLVEERRKDWKAGTTQGMDWEEVKKRLRKAK